MFVCNIKITIKSLKLVHVYTIKKKNYKNNDLPHNGGLLSIKRNRPTLVQKIWYCYHTLWEESSPIQAQETIDKVLPTLPEEVAMTMSEEEHGLEREVSLCVGCEGEGDRLGEGRIVMTQQRRELA